MNRMNKSLPGKPLSPLSEDCPRPPYARELCAFAAPEDDPPDPEKEEDDSTQTLHMGTPEKKHGCIYVHQPFQMGVPTLTRLSLQKAICCWLKGKMKDTPQGL